MKLSKDGTILSLSKEDNVNIIANYLNDYIQKTSSFDMNFHLGLFMNGLIATALRNEKELLEMTNTEILADLLAVGLTSDQYELVLELQDNWIRKE